METYLEARKVCSLIPRRPQHSKTPLRVTEGYIFLRAEIKGKISFQEDLHVYTCTLKHTERGKERVFRYFSRSDLEKMWKHWQRGQYSWVRQLVHCFLGGVQIIGWQEWQLHYMTKSDNPQLLFLEGDRGEDLAKMGEGVQLVALRQPYVVWHLLCGPEGDWGCLSKSSCHMVSICIPFPKTSCQSSYAVLHWNLLNIFSFPWIGDNSVSWGEESS